MRSFIIGFVFALLPAQALALPQVEQGITASPAVTAAPTCTHTILKQPSFGRVCTNYSKTLTYTSYTDCGVGCTLITKKLGLGLPCRTVRYNPGHTGTVVTSCKPPRATTTKAVTRYSRPTVTSSL